MIESSKRPVIYIMSPYTKGDVAINTRFQCEIFDRLMDDKRVWPVVPLWSHFQHIMFPRQYKDWIEYDLALFPRYDAGLRLTASYAPLSYMQHESSGADGEEKEFARLNKPVFQSIPELYLWVEEKRQS